jgi:hypothetical protein
MKKNTFIIQSLLVIGLCNAPVYGMNGSSSSNGFSANDLKQLRIFFTEKKEVLQDLYYNNRLNASAAGKFIAFAAKPGVPTALRFVEDCMLTAGDRNSILSQPAGLLLNVLNCSSIGRGVTEALQGSLVKGGRLSQTVNTVAHPQGIAVNFLQANRESIDALLNYAAPKFITHAPVIVHMLNAGEHYLREQEAKSAYSIVRADSAGITDNYWGDDDIVGENQNNSLIIAAKFDDIFNNALLELDALHVRSVKTIDSVPNIDTALLTALDKMKSSVSNQKNRSELQLDDEGYDSLIFDWTRDNKKNK